MFSIQEQECRMHFISRTNKHGNERMPAATLQLVYRSSNDVLSEFSSDLKASLYRRPAPAAGDAIRDLIAKHTELQDRNDHTYFELARTRKTDWMAWLCTHPVETHPNRLVMARGQGSTPDEACRAALVDFDTRAALAAQIPQQGEA